MNTPGRLAAAVVVLVLLAATFVFILLDIWQGDDRWGFTAAVTGAAGFLGGMALGAWIESHPS